MGAIANTVDAVTGGGIRPLVEIFWTGGFDSTFRMIQLAEKNVDIQPYYLSDNRLSEKNELNAIEKITAILMEKETTNAVIKPLIIVSMNDRIENVAISNAWSKLREKDFFGSQYDWLARFSINHKGVELSIHEDDKAVVLINKYGKLKKIYDPITGDNFCLDTKSSDEDLSVLFENYHLPLVEWSKVKMRDYYVSHGYEDVMNLTWFCYTPRHGKPCGTCNPCMYTIEEGMRERFTKESLFIYDCKKFTQKIGIYPVIQRIRGKGID